MRVLMAIFNLKNVDFFTGGSDQQTKNRKWNFENKLKKKWEKGIDKKCLQGENQG